MTSSGIFIWQEMGSFEFSLIVSPTILHRLWSLVLCEAWAVNTTLFCKLNLAFVSFEEELQTVPTMDKISPIKNKWHISTCSFFLE